MNINIVDTDDSDLLKIQELFKNNKLEITTIHPLNFPNYGFYGIKNLYTITSMCVAYIFIVDYPENEKTRKYFSCGYCCSSFQDLCDLIIPVQKLY